MDEQPQKTRITREELANLFNDLFFLFQQNVENNEDFTQGVARFNVGDREFKVFLEFDDRNFATLTIKERT